MVSHRGLLQHENEGSRSRRRRREIVMERDGYRCVKCGTTEDLTLDHVVPLSRGGTHRIENREACCQSCNAAKGNSLAGVSPLLIRAEHKRLRRMRRASPKWLSKNEAPGTQQAQIGGPPKTQHVGDNASAPKSATKELRERTQEPIPLYVKLVDAIYVRWFGMGR